jgi:hypothetical protein
MVEGKARLPAVAIVLDDLLEELFERSSHGRHAALRWRAALPRSSERAVGNRAS